MYQPVGRIAACTAVLLFFLVPTFASNTFEFSGAFSEDDILLQYQFTLGAGSTVTIESFSYAGNGSTISAGGFAPVLSLFGTEISGDRVLLTFDDGGSAPGGCGPRLIDSVSNACLDGFVTRVLGAGTYLVTLSENDNTPNGPDLLGGFNETGNGNFTGINQGFPGEAFLDPFGNQRTANFDFTISGVDTAQVLPEPSTISLLIAGLGLLAGAARVRKMKIRQNA